MIRKNRLGNGSSERQQNRVRNERINKIKTELGYRIGEATERVRLFGNSDDSFIGFAVSPVTRPVSVGAIAGPAVYPEFDKRSAKSLLVEWGVIASSEEKRKVAVLQKLLGELEVMDRPSVPFKSYDKLRVSQQAASSLKHAQQVIAD